MTIKLGITGGMGSGKSIVSHLLEIMSIPVYIADIESKRLTATVPQIRKELISLLGEEVYCNGELNKTLLAQYLFGHAEHTQKINSIIHPHVKKDFSEWIKVHADSNIIAMESAILIEAGFTHEVDYIIMVYAPMELRIQRAIKRDSSSPEAITERINSQMRDEEKVKSAHYVILNDDKTAVLPQVQSVLASFRKDNIY